MLYQEQLRNLLKLSPKNCPFVKYIDSYTVKYLGKGLIHSDVAVKPLFFSNLRCEVRANAETREQRRRFILFRSENHRYWAARVSFFLIFYQFSQFFLNFRNFFLDFRNFQPFFCRDLSIGLADANFPSNKHPGFAKK